MYRYTKKNSKKYHISAELYCFFLNFAYIIPFHTLNFYPNRKS